MSALNRALADFDRALALQPNDANIKQQAASTYNARGCKGSGSQAIKDLNRAIELDGSRALFYANRAIEYLNQDNHDRAITDLTEACKRDPQPDYIKVLAAAFNAKGMAIVKSFGNAYTRPSRWELQNALEYFKAAAKYDPSSSAYRENRDFVQRIMR